MPPKSLAPDEAGPYEPTCQSPKDQGEKGLCEAIRANDIAAENLHWVRIGTGAVLLSLILTGLAAWAAAVAAKAATISVKHAEADAAEQATRFTDQLAVAQESALAAKNGAAAAGRSADLARAAMVLTQGARMTFADVGKDCTFNADGTLAGLTVRIVWQNTGNTPAENVQHYAWIGVGEDIPASFGERDQPGDPSVVGTAVRLYSGTLDVRQDEIADIVSGKLKLFLWGWVEYDDVFDETPRHRTEYCAVMRAPTGPHRAPDFYNVGPFNGSDGGCSRPPQTPKRKKAAIQ